MKQLTAAMIATFGVLAFEANAAAEQKFQKLTGAQIQARFPGMELTDEAHWGEIFERNGTLTITSMGHKSSGNWRVQKDQLASTPEKNQAVAATRFGFPEKRRAEKPGFDCSPGSCAAKAYSRQVTGRRLLR